MADFRDGLRSELMAALDRPPRRQVLAARFGGIGVLVAAIVAALLIGSGVHPPPAGADVEVRHDAGRVIVRLTDHESTPAEIEAATDKAGLDIRVEAVPAGPSAVGRFVSEEATGADIRDLTRLDEAGTTYLAFSLPEHWAGTLTLFLGRTARGSERYFAPSDAFAPGEPMACADGIGKPLRSLLPRFRDLHLEVRATGPQGATAALSIEDALDRGLGDEPIATAIATSPSTVIVFLGQQLGPEASDPC